MSFVYWAIATLTLYGDLLKRRFPAREVLTILYASALAILAVIVLVNFKKKSPRHFSTHEGKNLSVCVFFLIIAYWVELFVSITLFSGTSFFSALSTALYICIPWLYTLAILHCYPEFNLSRFASIYFILMIPINLVGIIQHNVNHSFFISTAYNEEGGIIERHLIGGGSFMRFPSIFVSADRYSGVGLMQCYLALMMFLSPRRKRGWELVWLLFNIASGIVALLIAGARSRILILLVASLLLGVTLLKVSTSTRGWLVLIRAFRTWFVGILFIGVVSVFTLVVMPDSVKKSVDWLDNFPVIDFLKKSFEEKDVQSRLGEAYEQSLVPERISWFGNGLGASGLGKPGEHGIRDLWEECGIVGGAFILLCYAGIVWILASLALRALMRGDPFRVLVFCIPLLILITALLSGLSFALEYSLGILLTVSLAAVMSYGRVAKREFVSRHFPSHREES